MGISESASFQSVRKSRYRSRPGTIAYGINPVGDVIGWYVDGDNVNHGFVRNPWGKITTFDAPAAGTGAGQGTSAYGMNTWGVIVGYFTDNNGVVHGFVRDLWVRSSPSMPQTRAQARGRAPGSTTSTMRARSAAPASTAPMRYTGSWLHRVATTPRMRLLVRERVISRALTAQPFMP